MGRRSRFGSPPGQGEVAERLQERVHTRVAEAQGGDAAALQGGLWTLEACWLRRRHG